MREERRGIGALEQLTDDVACWLAKDQRKERGRASVNTDLDAKITGDRERRLES
jgi:hypothetical protein